MVQQDSKPSPIGRTEPKPTAVELTLQDRELVPKGENLSVLVAVADRYQP
jgi:hypothetical protein